MPNPVYALLLLFLIFNIFLFISFVINLVYKFKSEDQPQQKEEENKNSKIYYIEKTVEPKKRRRRKPQIALKGQILSESEVKKIIDEKDQ